MDLHRSWLNLNKSNMDLKSSHSVHPILFEYQFKSNLDPNSLDLNISSSGIPHIKVELGSVKLARMRTLAGPVSIHNFFCHLLSATGAIVNVDNIILKYFVNVKIEKNFWKD